MTMERLTIDDFIWGPHRKPLTPYLYTADWAMIFSVVRSCGQEYADTPHALLGARGNRPSSRRTAKQSDELAPPHIAPRSLRRYLRLKHSRRDSSSKGVRSKTDVRFGSKADICAVKRHVRFTPESGHVRCTSACPLWANSGHWGDHERSGSNAATRGKITLISVNSPGCVSTSIEPPCCLTMMS